MPTYQYRCQTCEGEFELRQSFTDDALTTCIDVECRGPVNKVFSGVGISFKGDGFYKNDHGSSAKGRSSEKVRLHQRFIGFRFDGFGVLERGLVQLGFVQCKGHPQEGRLVGQFDELHHLGVFGRQGILGQHVLEQPVPK